MRRDLTGPECVAWVARTAEQYLLDCSDPLEDAVWKLDQVMAAYAHVRATGPIFGLTIPDQLRDEIAMPCAAVIEQAIDECRVMMAHRFGEAGIETFFKRGRRWGLSLEGDPGPAPVQLTVDASIRAAAQRLVKRVRDVQATTAYWLAVAYDPYDIPPDEVVASVIRPPRSDLDAYVAALYDRGVHVPESLVSLYRECDGITIGWVRNTDAGPELDQLSPHEQIICSFEDVFGLLDEHAPDEIMIGNRGTSWLLHRKTGEVFDQDHIHYKPSLLAHLDELFETFGLYQRLELETSS